jgi:3-keto-disaccharide hydrolase
MNWRRSILRLAALAIVLWFTRCSSAEEDWIQLFNGRDLTGWTPKIVEHQAGDNFADTFRVEDGILKVRYDKYDGDFRGRYGHLFYNRPLSHYIVRIEYRFVGEQAPGAEVWALRNSGIMFHGQTPESMRIDQSFPVSIEFQLLGGDGSKKRSTGNVCTPGTNIVLNDKFYTPHCANSTSKTFSGDQWVVAELEVHGNKLVRHKINGEVVLEYKEPQLDERDPDAKRMLDAGAEKMLSSGTISLQSESHPCEFRKVELTELED